MSRSLLHVVPRTPRVDFRWFLNHQNGSCDLRLGSDAAIRSWLCLGHPVVKHRHWWLGWGGSGTREKHRPEIMFNGDFPGNVGIFHGYMLVYLRLTAGRNPANKEFHPCFFCMKIRLKNGEILHSNCMVILGFLLHQPYYCTPKCFTNWFRSWFETWMKPASNYGPFGWYRGLAADTSTVTCQDSGDFTSGW